MKSLQIPEIVNRLLCNIHQISASDNHLYNYSTANKFYISTVKEENFSSSMMVNLTGLIIRLT